MKDADFDSTQAGQFAHNLAKELFPICRSITGPGVRQTLASLRRFLPLEMHEVPSGTDVLDWTVPDEWTIRGGYLEHESGERIVDFADNNLHVLGYSEPVDTWLSHEELGDHLYSLPDQPNAIPYITSYYSRRWGFCLTDEQRKMLPVGRYHAVVDSDLRPGVLNFADYVIPGDCRQEIMLSTYICHPSMANNELSGPVVMTALGRWLMSLPSRRYTYRLIFIPETIGSIVYLSRNLDYLKRTVVAGFNLSCIGDDRCYSYLPSRAGDTIADKAAIQALRGIDPAFKRYSWLQRGSDERQYCAPGVDLPIASIMRSKYGEYPEYHTSLDDLNFVTPEGLQGGFNAVQAAIKNLESDMTLRVTVLGEPQLGKRGLYPTLSTKTSGAQVQTMMDLISYCDGTMSLIDIGDIIGQSASDLAVVAQPLIEKGLLEVVGKP
jgi:aminopeptidase-like protein